MKPRVIVLRAAGTNCDMETAFAFKTAGAEPEFVHVNRLKSGKPRLDDYHILAIPGGFTYGDDIGSGKILANELRFTLFDGIKKFLSEGKIIIGICNGFQVLVKAGLLPDITGKKEIEATLNLNDSARFEDRWIHLRKSKIKNQKSKCIWTRYVKEIIELPVAHGEGKFIPRDKDVLDKLRENGQIIFRYTDKNGKPAGYPHNPNGSVDDIAGICDPTGRILGMMPHPERFIEYTQHPRWTRGGVARYTDGLAVFRSGVEYMAGTGPSLHRSFF